MAVRRLKTRAQFQAVLVGASVSRTPHFALHRLALVGATAGAGQQSLFARTPANGWVGAMTPKRCARRAVTRNSIKRQIYAVSNALDDCLQGAAYVVRLRAAFDRSRVVSATSDLLKAAVRAELMQLFAQLHGDRAPAPALRKVPV